MITRSPRRLVAWLACAALLGILVLRLPHGARAQQPPIYTFTHDVAADFAQACALLDQVIVSDANGGELRLPATLEDSFAGSGVDATRWLTGSTYTWYSPHITVTDGSLTLDAAWLRSIDNFQTVQPRFFEAGAGPAVPGQPYGWADLGYYREHPPLFYEPHVTLTPAPTPGTPVPTATPSYPDDSAVRLFIADEYGDGYTRGHDGTADNPYYDTLLTWIDFKQPHVFRIEWEDAETRFYVDGALAGVAPGGTSLDAWAFLYQQTPSTYGGSPLRVEWVRAGQYVPEGTYTSCALDAGQSVDWRTADWLVPLEGGTVSVDTRSSEDALAWSAWQPVSAGLIDSPDGRYLQYRVQLTGSSVLHSPELRRISLCAGGGCAPPTPTPLPTATPTLPPTVAPTAPPTTAPTTAPTLPPTIAATATPTSPPTVAPTKAPTRAPTGVPTGEGTPEVEPGATETPVSLVPYYRTYLPLVGE